MNEAIQSITRKSNRLKSKQSNYLVFSHNSSIFKFIKRGKANMKWFQKSTYFYFMLIDLPQHDFRSRLRYNHKEKIIKKINNSANSDENEPKP